MSAKKLDKKRAFGLDNQALGRISDSLALWGMLGKALLNSRPSVTCEPGGPREGSLTLTQLAEAIARWRVLGSEVRPTRPEMNWQPAQGMVDAMRTWGEVRKTEYQTILQESETRLAPFGEPLRVDFGTHRWLKGEREESYSDWLAWIVDQLKNPEEVFALFKLGNQGTVISECAGCQQLVKREKGIEVPTGGGRLDIHIEYQRSESDKVALIVIEVKRVSTAEAVLEKQAGYRVWMDEQNDYSPERRFPVLLATEGEEEEEIPGGFKLVSWAHVCNQLRRIARRYGWLLEENGPLGVCPLSQG